MVKIAKINLKSRLKRKINSLELWKHKKGYGCVQGSRTLIKHNKLD